MLPRAADYDRSRPRRPLKVLSGVRELKRARGRRAVEPVYAAAHAARAFISLPLTPRPDQSHSVCAEEMGESCVVGLSIVGPDPSTWKCSTLRHAEQRSVAEPLMECAIRAF